MAIKCLLFVKPIGSFVVCILILYFFYLRNSIVFTLICLRSYRRMQAYIYKPFIAIGRSKQTRKKTHKNKQNSLSSTHFKYKPNINNQPFLLPLFFVYASVCAALRWAHLSLQQIYIK